MSPLARFARARAIATRTSLALVAAVAAIFAVATAKPFGCGNTAEPDPDTQTCHTANGDRSLHYWALVTDDGRHMNGFLAGSTTAPGRPPANTFLYVGALTRSAMSAGPRHQGTPRPGVGGGRTRAGAGL